MKKIMKAISQVLSLSILLCIVIPSNSVSANYLRGKGGTEKVKAPKAPKPPKAPKDKKSKAAGYEETKNIKKEFDISSSETLKVINEFGKIHFETWESKKVSFDIEVLVVQPKQDKAKEIIEQIQPKFEKSAGKYVKCEVKLPKNRNQNNEQKMEVNIMVKMPKGVDLDIQNSFGDVYLPDIEGNIDLNLQYGELKAGNLGGKENNIKVGFGEARIGDFEKADIKISYSEFEIGSGNKLELNSQFSTGEVGDFNALQAKIMYGEVDAGSMNTLEGDFQFSSVELKKIKSSAIFKANYGDGVEIGEIAKGFQKIDATAEFAEVELNFEEGSNFLLEAKVDFGSLDYSKDDFRKMNVDKQKYIPSSTYKGIYGNGENPSSKVTIQSSYSDIEIN